MAEISQRRGEDERRGEEAARRRRGRGAARRDAAVDGNRGCRPQPSTAARTTGRGRGALPPPGGPRRRWRAAGGGRLRGLTPRVGGGAGTVAADGFAGKGAGHSVDGAPGRPRLRGEGAARHPRSLTPRRVEREGGGTARRGRGRVDGGGEERRPADKAAKPPCRMSLRTRPRLRGRREGNGGARAAGRESARLPRPPFAGGGRADSHGARRCEGG